MADYPDTRHKMLRAGYKLIYSRPCSKCSAATDRWRTRNGREITMDHSDDAHAKVQAHFNTCAVAGRMRDGSEHEALSSFAARTQAMAVVTVDRFGNVKFQVDRLCDPADMHIALSNAADAVRDHLVQIVQQEPL